MSYTLQEIVDATRYRLNNFEKPYLWLDAELAFYANDVINTICRDARVLEDSTTAAVCNFSTVIDQIDYALHSSIIYVKSVKLTDASSNLILLDKFTNQQMEECYTSWRTQDHAQPINYILDYQPGYISLYSKPDAIYPISLTVIRYPITQLTATSMSAQTPEINSMWQETIVDGMCAKALQKRGDNTYDANLSAMYYAQFRKAIADMKRINNLYESNCETAGPVGGFV